MKKIMKLRKNYHLKVKSLKQKREKMIVVNWLILDLLKKQNMKKELLVDFKWIVLLEKEHQSACLLDFYRRKKFIYDLF
ncbi:hypothetical protein D6D54_01125 [Spiroplasma poulsonii]|uniref:Uncharacterized protein n=1 Tax=Spiroplasma poulsonii TaxID=2138 RepID=A0A3S0SMG7_9MOLU|nr:hypothetical protein D6D54_01125 [Spiroplasma poulsonii]